MPGRQHIGPEVARGREQIGELHAVVAGNARDRRFARRVARDERLHHRLAEAGLVVEHIMRDAERRRDGARVADVAPRTAGALTCGAPIIVKPQGHADDIVALVLEQGRDHGGIHTARHRDNDTGGGRRLVDVEAVHTCVRGMSAARRSIGRPLISSASWITQDVVFAALFPAVVSNGNINGGILKV